MNGEALKGLCDCSKYTLPNYRAQHISRCMPDRMCIITFKKGLKMSKSSTSLFHFDHSAGRSRFLGRLKFHVVANTLTNNSLLKRSYRGISNLLADSAKISSVRFLQFSTSLDTCCQSSPCRGSACKHFFFTSSCSSYNVYNCETNSNHGNFKWMDSVN